jgi:large subunit ribosomal protein L25
MATKKQVTLTAQPRTVMRKHVRALRRQGILPAHIYGHGASVPVQVDARTFERLRETHQTTGVITLAIAGQTQPETVLVRHIDHEPKTGKMLHIDFARVLMHETIHAHVPLHVVGVAPAAKETGGTVLVLLETIEIECLPGDLPDALTVDATKLTALDVVLRVSDISVPPGVKVLDAPDEVVVKVEPPRVSTEPTSTETATAANEPPATTQQPTP